MSKTAKALIKKHEGYRDEVYLDSEGLPTVGWGHLLNVGTSFPKEASQVLFNVDFERAVRDYNTFGFQLDPVRRDVVINMLFNLGWSRFKGFKQLIGALYVKDWAEAKAQMIDSKWHGQVGIRAIELEAMMETGEYQ